MIPSVPESHKVYDITKDYDWNYRHVPVSEPSDEQSVLNLPGSWTYAGLKAPSPFSIAAGPLLNSQWIAYYARRGFDILTYKTVRSRYRASYSLPNLVPVESDGVEKPGGWTGESATMQGSWAVSFGMPSQEPDVWRQDVSRAKESLLPGQLLSVSVVATPEEGDDLQTIARDYAQCARWAETSGADVVEVNFSCPNVASADGMLYMQAEASHQVLKRVRDAVEGVPLLVKLGYLQDPELARAWIELSEGLVQGLVMINCVGSHVRDADGQALFDGASRGIAGTAIREAVRAQVALFNRLIREHGASVRTLSVGGISELADVREHLDLGSESVQVATAAMRDPDWAVRMKRGLV